MTVTPFGQYQLTADPTYRPAPGFLAFIDQQVAAFRQEAETTTNAQGGTNP